MADTPPRQDRFRPVQAVLDAWRRFAPAMPADDDVDRRLVRSSAVVAVGYRPATRTLQVEFFSGWVCEARGVPATLYQRLMQTQSFDRVFRSDVQARYALQPVGRLTPVFGG